MVLLLSLRQASVCVCVCVCVWASGRIRTGLITADNRGISTSAFDISCLFWKLNNAWKRPVRSCCPVHCLRGGMRTVLSATRQRPSVTRQRGAAAMTDRSLLSRSIYNGNLYFWSPEEVVLRDKALEMRRSSIDAFSTATESQRRVRLTVHFLERWMRKMCISPFFSYTALTRLFIGAIIHSPPARWAIFPTEC